MTFITENDQQTAVTCYADNFPIEEAPISKEERRKIREQKRRVEDQSIAITSHIILCVDQSTSMNEADVFGHRSRSRAAFYAIANEMIVAPLIHGHFTYTDVVTLVEMRTESEIFPTIYMEPFTWELYNKIVALAGEPLRAKGCGNYVPALETCYHLLNKTDNKNCALLLLFLSDGRPSDKALKRGMSTRDLCLNAVNSICGKFGKRLAFGGFGFASNSDPNRFELMRAMVDSAKGFGCNAVFAEGIDTQSIRRALQGMTTSLISTKTGLSSLAGGVMRTAGEPKALVKGMVEDRAREDGADIIFDPNQYDFYYIKTKNQNLKRYMARQISHRDGCEGYYRSQIEFDQKPLILMLWALQ